MKVVHVLLDTAHGPLTYQDLAAGGRGVTGSEQALLYLARAQAQAGHQVSVYLPTDTPGFQEGLELLDVRTAWPRLRRLDFADVVVAWLSADPLRIAPPTALRVHSLQINDFLLCGAGYEQFVDVYVCVSETHRAHLWTEANHPVGSAPVEIIPNGVDLGRFGGRAERTPRRCVYLSSPDRGLHWLLALWPEVRFAYPDAELHVFYEVQRWLDQAVLLNSEVGLRARYVVRRTNDLARHGVLFRGPLSPEVLAQDLLQAEVLLYPCDTVRYTEGFGVAVLEACAAGVVPVITDCDALGEVYGESGALLVPRGDGGRWTDTYLEAVLKLLGAPSEIEHRRERVQAFATTYDWRRVAEQWSDMIHRRTEEKRRSP